jgi:hypothetical protein
MDMDPERRELKAEAAAIEQQREREERSHREHQQKIDNLYLQHIWSLEAEIRDLKISALRPRHGFMRLFIRDLETNPHAQYSVHKYGMWYWVINFPAVTALFFLAPVVWLKWGLYITLIYSIYANFATDYGAMSAAMAAFKDRPPLPPVPLEPASRTDETLE